MARWWLIVVLVGGCGGMTSGEPEQESKVVLVDHCSPGPATQCCPLCCQQPMPNGCCPGVKLRLTLENPGKHTVNWFLRVTNFDGSIHLESYNQPMRAEDTEAFEFEVFSNDFHVDIMKTDTEQWDEIPGRLTQVIRQCR